VSAAARRCGWASREPLIEYHDREWGVPVHDDRKHFEFLVLDGAQAGLSWETILRKRDAYREALERFDPRRVARFTPARIERLLENPGIVRNRLKIEGAVRNAGAFLRVQDEFGGFDPRIRSFTGGRTARNRFRRLRDLPATSPESEAMSRDLKSRGFTFVGSRICYAYMQAAGMVNDHVTC
jgi:DNA-3-methyladenine glycosylase I